MRKRKPVRIVPCYRKGKEHAGYADGFIVHHDDRVVRELPPPPEKVDDEPTTSSNGVKESGDGG